MKNRIIVATCALILLIWVAGAQAVSQPEGLVSMKSAYSVDQTVTRFKQKAQARGLRIFDTIDHAQGADKAGLKLRPTAVVIFGNPKAGTPFMQCAQTVAIDLPMKLLVWQDADGQTWLGYNDPAWIAKRHHALKCPAIAPISKTLSTLATATAGSPDADD